MNNLKHIFAIVLLALVCIPGLAFAGDTLPEPTGPGTSDRNPLITCGNQGQDPCDFVHLMNLIQNLMNWIFMFATFIVAFMFMYAGVLLITAVGNPVQIQKAKNIFKRVVVGFLIMFMAFITIGELLQKLGADAFFIDIVK